ncbi:S41 family peptidase [Ornithinibacillus sp. 4-3]|uniref:S41 family peptidase n=1 Tax=Ornithinibacillus sp. 4-3 TaxID=3231488 RepID=A0AB39HTU6_9BACI
MKKINIVFIFVAALAIGFVGAIAGVKVAEQFLPNAQQNIVLPDSNANEGTNQGSTTDSHAQFDKLAQTYELIKQYYIEDVEDEVLIEGALQGMLEALGDPYSSYMDLESMSRFNEQIEASFEGIGAEVSMVNGKVTIVSPIKDSPAEAAGLRPNDQINRIDGDTIEDLDLNQAVERIRGEKGTEVKIEIIRPGVENPFELTIVRDEIPLETVHVEKDESDGKNTGIIEISSFSETTAADFAEELSKLEEDGIEGLVIDVRGNPGGLLQSVEQILGNFVPEDIPIYQIESADGETVSYYSDLPEKKPYPITVLIDEGSASASEILAVALKEMGYDVIGLTSYGKGTVQQAVPLGDGSTVKLTFQKWLSPEGNWIHENGVEPTIEQEQPEYYLVHPVQLENTAKLNVEGDHIKNLQQILIGLGYDMEATGIFDVQMQNAVKDFQQKNDLQVTGEVDQQTGDLLEAKIIEKIRDKDDDLQLNKAIEALYQ